MISDNPQERIKLKMFHSTLLHENDVDIKELKSSENIVPKGQIDEQKVLGNFYQIRYDIHELIASEINLLIAKNNKTTST